MKNLRWGLLFVLVAGVFVSTGCNSMPKLLSRAEYDHLRSIERLNRDQGALMTALIVEKDRLKLLLETSESQMAALGRDATSARDALDAKSKLLRIQQDALKAEQERIAKLQQQLQDLESQLADAKVQMPGDLPAGVTAIEGDFGVGVRIEGDLLFGAGRADLKEGGAKVVKEIAKIDMLQNPEYFLRVCGFTDSDPIKYSAGRWKDNYQLSGARAYAVLVALRKEGVDPGRMHYSGYGPARLITKDGKEDKAKSRRVEIYVIPPRKPLTDTKTEAPE